MVPNSEHGVHFEEVEDGVYGIVATAGGVQVGWCRQQSDRWFLFDMDENPISSEFEGFSTAKAEGLMLFAYLSGSRNLGH